MKPFVPLFLFLVACGPAAGSATFDAAAPITGDVLITGNKGEDTISLIDLDTGTEHARLETGHQPHEIAISPNGARAAVVAYGGTTIDIIDVASASRVDRIDLSPNRRPHGLLWLPDNRLIATTEGSDSLTIVDMADRSVSAIATAQEGSHMVAVNADLTRAYVANMGSGTVSVIDLEAGAKLRDIPAGDTPEGIAISPDGATLWVADRDNAQLFAFDTTSFERVAEIGVGNFPIRVAVSPDGGTVVTSNYAGGSLTLVDEESRTVDRTILVSGSVGAAQVTILFSSDGRTLYVAETGRNRIAAVELESGEVVRRYDAGEDSDGLAVTTIGATD
ncbi:beta-propeller fold lactonase family protein [Parasphingopyxis algicola]|uniref:YncE family protein n=1 Tax=Parasphingopyxis algicola TaxID=2026624 RepID=UPI0015A0F578|nr:beta-propeller fold lactonase family protein [Parasphingopyxis algicola]QLC25482.1 beta-propeller fold lactonase family protein [Parasphingopyxis algicola]